MRNQKKKSPTKDIVFFGPDGAGKTTLAQLLVDYFHSNGYRSRITWMRARHSLAWLLAKFFKRYGYYRKVISPNGKKDYYIFDPTLLPKMKTLWYFFEFISILPWIITKVYLPKALGYIVVSERYVVDTVVYLGYWVGHDTMNSFLAKVLLNFISPKSVIVHMDAQTSVLLQRRPEDFINRDYITFQRNAYTEFAKSLHAIHIDTTVHTVDENFRYITKYLEKLE
jgi:thymidylate kinase